MCSGLDVVAHPTGPWLVRAGGRTWAVPPALGRSLLVFRDTRPTGAELRAAAAPPDMPPAAWHRFADAVASAMDGSGPVPGRTPAAVWLRLPLVPGPQVRMMVRPLVRLAADHVLLIAAVCGALAVTVAPPWTPAAQADQAGLAGGLLLFLGTALLHELGHAAALARAGYPPGGIGAGLLFVVPVLFADVTAVGALPRRRRLAVDLAGPAWQLGAAGLLAAAGTWWAPAAVAALLALGAVCWSLVPFLRADAYWALCDLLDVGSLERDAGPPPGRAVRRALVAYRLANLVVLLGLAVLVPARWGPRVADLGARVCPGAPGFLITGVVVVLVLVLWAGVARRGVVLWRGLRPPD